MKVPDYGLDAPGVVARMLTLGPAAVALGLALPAAVPALRHPGGAWPWVLGTLVGGGLAYMLTGGMMVLSSRWGKLRARDRLLDALPLAPDARVLDVGCGRGLLLVGAARRVQRGRAVGLDLWSQRDLGANSRAATLANAAAEGVADRVEVHDGDMRAMPFADASFDAVVSSLAIHNVSGRAERRRALAEISRVLKPGGRVALMDIAHVGQYAADLRALGLAEVRTAGVSPFVFPPARVLFARK